MTQQRWITALVLTAGVSVFGFRLLTAQESEPAVPKQRASPKLIREAMAERAIAERAIATAAAPHTVGRTVQDLRTIADDLDKGDQKAEAGRLRVVIREIVRRSEHEIAEKKAQITRLNAEIEELKWATAQ